MSTAMLGPSGLGAGTRVLAYTTLDLPGALRFQRSATVALAPRLRTGYQSIARNSPPILRGTPSSRSSAHSSPGPSYVSRDR